METIKAVPFVKDAQEGNKSHEIERNPQEWVKVKLWGSPFDFGVSSIVSTGHFKLLGFSYDFRPFLRRFVYKQHGQWHEVYALNKTNVRHLIGGKIDEIKEL